MFKAVKQALLQQEQRFNSSDIFNAQMTVDQIEQYCITTPEAEQLIKQLFSKLNLSMRGYHKLLKVARTIADLENSTLIDLPHVQEASMYRSLDKTLEGRRS
jgi:magnesium chelatase family protein